MAKATIAGQDYEIPPLKFKALKKCWPLIQKVQAGGNPADALAKVEDIFLLAQSGAIDPKEGSTRALSLFIEAQSQNVAVDAMDAIVGIVAIGLERKHPEMTLEKIEEEMDAADIKGFRQTMRDMMVESGLIGKDAGENAQMGEGLGALPDAPSMEISTPSSQNSSPQDAVEATGT